MKINLYLYFYWSFFIISSCVSSKKYNQLQRVQQEQLENIQKLEIQSNRSLELEQELARTKIQLTKTEDVLTTFYEKYTGQNEIKFNIDSLNPLNIQVNRKMDSLLHHIQILDRNISINQQTIQALNEELSTLKNTNGSKENDNKSDTNKNEILTLKQELAHLTQLNQTQNNEILQLKASSKNSKANTELTDPNTKISQLEQEINIQKELQSNLINDISKKDQTIKLLNQNILDKSNQIFDLSLRASKIEDNGYLKKLEDSLDHKNNQLLVLNKKIQEQKNAGSYKKDSLNQQKVNLQHKQQLADLKFQIHQLNTEITNKNAKIKTLESNLNQDENLNIAKKKFQDTIALLRKEIAKKESQLSAEHHIKYEPKSNENKPVGKIQNSNSPLSKSLVNKISGLAQEIPEAKLEIKSDQNEIHVFIPQKFLFEDEAVVLKENGSNLIYKIINHLKNHPNYSIEIIGYAAKTISKAKTNDIHFRRAITIGKLMSISGINPDQLLIRSKQEDDFDHSQNIPTGIEMVIKPK
ncbi:MAG: hypothetical protein IPQ02_10815 [Saprospiraceae bacterium]|nr:hypothetical protein [Candidatus Defluviibacterium haderslevense]